MSVIESAAGELRLVGGRLCLDFVNTVGGRRKAPRRRRSGVKAELVLHEKLNTYLDLVCWARHTALIAERDAHRLIRRSIIHKNEVSAVLERALLFREALYRIFKAVLAGATPSRADIVILNEELLWARMHQQLVTDDQGFRYEWSREDEFERMLWPVAHSAAELLTSADLSRLRECGGEDCGWLFEDSSRNRSRQWCYMEACGNLSKVRRFRSRVQKAR